MLICFDSYLNIAITRFTNNRCANRRYPPATIGTVQSFWGQGLYVLLAHFGSSSSAYNQNKTSNIIMK